MSPHREWELDEDCPAGCGGKRAHKYGRDLATCGDQKCAYEMRARETRGNKYGNRGGGPSRKTAPMYNAVHARARRAIRGKPCALEDVTCSGRIEAALSPDVPIESLSLSDVGALYYAGVNTEEAYRPLCRSHHVREGNMAASVRRSPVVARAIRVEAVRNDHYCGDPCVVCGWLRQYDEAALHVVPRVEGDGLPLPWTPQHEAKALAERRRKAEEALWP